MKWHGFSLATAFAGINRPMPPALARLGKSGSVLRARPADAWWPLVFLRRAPEQQRVQEPLTAEASRPVRGAQAPVAMLPPISFRFPAPAS